MSKNTSQNKNRDDMVPNRWRYLKEQKGPMWRFRHVSAYACMVPRDPPEFDSTGKPVLKPWVEKPGVLFKRGDIGRLPDDFKVPQLTKLSTGISYGLRR